MSHCTVLVCVRDPEDLAVALEPFNENTEVDPYRDYQEGEPRKFWAVEELRKTAGLNPDDATLTWPEVATAYNDHYRDDEDPESEDKYFAEEPDEAFPFGRMYRMSTYNPESKWDWYQVGGRWTGYFRIRPDADGDDRLIFGEPGTLTEANEDPLRCDGGPRGLLDLDAMRDEREAEARKMHARYNEVIEGLPTPLGWSHFREGITDRESGDQARQEYGAQPAKQALDQAEEFKHWFFSCPIDEYGRDLDEVVERARASAVPGYALLAPNGEWIAPGEMGWFGVSTDEEATRNAYNAAANRFIDELDTDWYLIAVDCHI